MPHMGYTLFTDFIKRRINHGGKKTRKKNAGRIKLKNFFSVYAGQHKS